MGLVWLVVYLSLSDCVTGENYVTQSKSSPEDVFFPYKDHYSPSFLASFRCNYIHSGFNVVVGCLQPHHFYVKPQIFDLQVQHCHLSFTHHIRSIISYWSDISPHKLPKMLNKWAFNLIYHKYCWCPDTSLHYFLVYLTFVVFITIYVTIFHQNHEIHLNLSLLGVDQIVSSSFWLLIIQCQVLSLDQPNEP